MSAPEKIKGDRRPVSFLDNSASTGSKGRITRTLSLGRWFSSRCTTDSRLSEDQLLERIITKFLEYVAKKNSESGSKSKNPAFQEGTFAVRKKRSLPTASLLSPRSPTSGQEGVINQEYIYKATAAMLNALRSYELDNLENVQLRLLPILVRVFPHIFDPALQALDQFLEIANGSLPQKEADWIGTIHKEMKRANKAKSLVDDAHRRYEAINAEVSRLQGGGRAVTLGKLNEEPIEKLRAALDRARKRPDKRVSQAPVEEAVELLVENHNGNKCNYKHQRRIDHLQQLKVSLANEDQLIDDHVKHFLTIQTFSEDITVVLAHPVMRGHFFRFLEKEGSHEIVAFLEAVDAWKKLFDTSNEEQGDGKRADNRRCPTIFIVDPITKTFTVTKIEKDPKKTHAELMHKEFFVPPKSEDSCYLSNSTKKGSNFLNINDVSGYPNRKQELEDAIHKKVWSPEMFDKMRSILISHLTHNYVRSSEHAFRRSPEFQEGLVALGFLGSGTKEDVDDNQTIELVEV